MNRKAIETAIGEYWIKTTAGGCYNCGDAFEAGVRWTLDIIHREMVKNMNEQGHIELTPEQFISLCRIEETKDGN